MTLQMYAGRKGWALQQRPRSTSSGRDEQGIYVIERRLTLEGDLTDEQRARLTDIAGRCPVSKRLIGPRRDSRRRLSDAGDESITKRYGNGEIVVVWKPDLCAHSTICFQGLPAVFDPRERPWVRVTAAPTARSCSQVETCPSGALSWERDPAAAGARHPPRPPRRQSRWRCRCQITGPPQRPARRARRPGGDAARRHRRRAAEGGVVLPLRPLCQ